MKSILLWPPDLFKNGLKKVPSGKAGLYKGAQTHWFGIRICFVSRKMNFYFEIKRNVIGEEQKFFRIRNFFIREKEYFNSN